MTRAIARLLQQIAEWLRDPAEARRWHCMWAKDFDRKELL